MALAALLQFSDRTMHGLLVIHSLVESTNRVALLKASSWNVGALCKDAAKEASCERTVGNIMHIMFPKQG